MVGTVQKIPRAPAYWGKEERNMASLTPVIVHAEKPVGTLFSKYFAEMRIWLDAHKIAPVDFRLSGGSSIGFDISFSSPEDANLFERTFGLEAQLTNVFFH
jgi:hypothetical protein